jgi:hypothetical protein
MIETPAGATWPERLYAALALVGLAGTWAQGLGYLELGLVGGNVRFWRDALAGPASTFLAVDILVLAAAVFVWVFGEGRRLGIAARWRWACFLGSLFVGISFAVPLFMAVRERRVRQLRPDERGVPAGMDLVAVAIGVAIALGVAAFSLAHPY